MRPLVMDPLAAIVNARLEDLAREAMAEGRAREARRARRRPDRRWPVSGLRRGFGRAASAPLPSARRGAPCPTC